MFQMCEIFEKSLLEKEARAHLRWTRALFERGGGVNLFFCFPDHDDSVPRPRRK